MNYFYFYDMFLILVFILFYFFKNINFLFFFFFNLLAKIKDILDCSFKLPNSSFFSIFIFVLLLTLCFFGYFSYSMCICSYIEFTLFLSFSFWLSSFFYYVSYDKFLIYLSKSGDNFLKSFSMMLIEIVSEFSRPVALTVRLTVNITVGHALISAIYSFFELSNLSYILMIFSIFMEFFVFFIQSYIFSRLIYLYINE